MSSRGMADLFLRVFIFPPLSIRLLACCCRPAARSSHPLFPSAAQRVSFISLLETALIGRLLFQTRGRCRMHVDPPFLDQGLGSFRFSTFPFYPLRRRTRPLTEDSLFRWAPFSTAFFSPSSCSGCSHSKNFCSREGVPEDVRRSSLSTLFRLPLFSPDVAGARFSGVRAAFGHTGDALFWKRFYLKAFVFIFFFLILKARLCKPPFFFTGSF